MRYCRPLTTKNKLCLFTTPAGITVREVPVGVELLLASLAVSALNQVSEGGKRERKLGLVVSSPFLQIPASYSPLESSELLRGEEERRLLGGADGHCVV